MDRERSKVLDKYNRLPTGLKASLWFMICSFFQKGISTLTTPIFTRLLDTTEYGQFSLFTSWFNILQVLVSLKLAGGIYQQSLVKYEDHQDEITSSLQGLTTFFVILSYAIYLPFRNSWNKIFGLNTVIMCAMFASIFANAIFDLWAYRQRLDYRYKALLLITVLVGIFKPVLGVFAVISTEDYKVEVRIITLVTVELIAYTILYIRQFKRCTGFYNKKFWKYSIRLNTPLIPHYLSQSVLSQSDRVMINMMCGTSEVGIYSVAYSISVIMNLVNNAVRDAINPFIYKNIKKENFDEIGKVSLSVIMAIALMDLIVIILAPEITWIFAPESYHDAIWVIPPIAMSIYFTFLYCLFADFEFYYEKTSFIMKASVAGAVINIVLNAVFIPLFGYVAAGYTTLFSYMLYCGCHYYAMRKVEIEFLNGKHVYKVKFICAISLLFIATGFMVMAFYNYTVVRFSFVGILVLPAFICRRRIIGIFKDRLIGSDMGK